MMINRIFGLLFFIAISFTIHAQTGIVKGTINEEVNGVKVSLPFATLYLEGTTVGTTSDMDGNFQFKLQPGTYNLMCSFMGYETYKQAITVMSGSETSVNVILKTEGIAIAEVEVVAKVSREGEKVLLMDQKNSSFAVEAIGAKELSFKGVSDAAGAVSKMTGITNAEGSGSLNVRGLGDRYNTTTLNRLPIPSDNPEVKNVDLSLFTTDVISYINIEKTYTSSLYGDFGGANIDIASKRLYGNDFLKLGFKVGQNSSVFGLDQFKHIDGASASGFYTEKVPDIDQIRSYENYGFTNSWDPKTKSVNPNYGFDISGGKSIKLDNGHFDIFLALAFDNENKYTERIERIVGATGVALTDMNGVEYDYKTQSNGILNLNYSVGKSEYFFNSLLLNSSNESLISLNGNIKDVGENAFRRRSEFNRNMILVNQLLGNHQLKHSFAINWGLAYNNVWNTLPDRRQTQFTTYDVLTNEGEFDTEPSGANFRYFHEFTDDEVAMNFDLHKIFGDDPEQYTHKLSLGYSGRYKNRNFINYQFNHDVNEFNVVDIDAADSYLNNANFTNRDFKIVIVEPRDINGNAKDGEEYYGFISTHAVNALWEWNFPPKFLLLTGIKGERVNQEITTRANQITGKGTNQKTFLFDELQILPSVSLKYAVNQKQNIRLAASKTYTLPQFQEMPFMSFSGISDETFGNPYLTISQVYNADIKWEFFPEGGLFSLAGFYKRIIDPINKTTLAGYQSSYFVANTGDWAYVYGVELEAKKDLYKANGNRLFVEGNLSLMASKMELNGEKIKKQTDNNFNANFNDATSELQGAAPILANASFGYIHSWSDKRSTSAVAVYNYTSDRLYAIGQSGRGNEYDQAINTLDFILKSKFGKVEFGFSAKNILNADYVRVLKNTVEENADHIIKEYKKGVSVSFSANYVF